MPCFCRAFHFVKGDYCVTPTARLSACLEILQEIYGSPRPLDQFIMGYFKQRRYAGSKDRAAILDQVYATLRNQAKIDWWLAEKASLSDLISLIPEAEDYTQNLARLRTLCYLIVCQGVPVTEIQALFRGERFGPDPLSEEEISLLAALGQIRALFNLAPHKSADLRHPDQPIDVQGEFPQWLLPILQRSLGDTVTENMQLMSQESPVDLRVNALKSNMDQMRQVFVDQAVIPADMSFAPWGIRLTRKMALQAMPAFKQGWFEIQAESSQILTEIIQAKPGEKIVDFCAGAGGKALALAAQMKNKGRIYVLDVHSTRLDNAQKRIKRAGIDTAQVKLLSSERDVWVKRHKGQFDHVLIDAPCSGSGTWGRNPDAKWRFQQENLDNLVKTQRSILESACRLVKPGGYLFYATCSLLAEENEDQVDWFLSEMPGFSPLDLKQRAETYLKTPLTTENSDWPSDVSQTHWLRLSPLKTDTDGFFISGFQRDLD